VANLSIMMMQIEIEDANWAALEVDAFEAGNAQDRILFPGVGEIPDSPSLDTIRMTLEYAQQAYESELRETLQNHVLFEVPSSSDLTLIMGSSDDSDTLFVAVKGSTCMQNWMDNLYPGPAELEPGGPKVHGGFLRAFKSMENSDGEDLVKQTLNDVLFQCENLRQIILVGHSMGGAIALFTALHFSRLNLGLPIHVILIGCPNVGDDNFATLCQNRFRSIIAFTDPLDPVTKLPPSSFHGFTCPGIRVPLSSGSASWAPGYFAGFKALRSLCTGKILNFLKNTGFLAEFLVKECHSVSRYCQKVNIFLDTFESSDLAQLLSLQLLRNAKKIDQNQIQEQMNSIRDSLTSYIGTILEELTIDAQAMYRYIEKADWKADWVKVSLTFAGLAYVANPYGVIPDFIPVIGRLDDYIVLRLVCRILEPEIAPHRLAIMEERRLANSI